MVLTILLIYHIVASFVNGLALSGSYGLMSADVDIIAALDAEFHVGLIATTAILMLSAMLGMRNFGTHSEQGPKLADNPEVAVNPTDYVYNPVTRQ